ncbi:putative Carboxylic ester hydrolase [Seiridium cardinale]
MVPEGNVNLYKLHDLGSVSLRDAAHIGKSLVKSFYGEDPEYSYWSGCSRSRTRIYTMASRRLVVNDFLNGTKPQDCEVDEMAAKAIEICDPLDGVTDGLISDMESCDRTFNTFDHVGDTFVRASTGVETNLSYQAALFPKYTWEGPNIIGASDSDLREFKPHGGKMLTFHGMSDRYVATESVEACFDAVSSTTEDVNDYYRLFLGPGVYHCSCVPDGKPTALLFQL